MTEKVKESISALIDEELSEIELHRLLRQYDHDHSVRDTIISFQQIRTVIQGKYRLSIRRQVELHSRICEAIEAEPDSTVKEVQPKRWRRPATGFAIAASVVVAVFIGINTERQLSPVGEEIAETQPVQAIDMSTTAALTNNPDLELRELDEEKQKRLIQYLNRHDRTRMNSYTRSVNYQRPGNNTSRSTSDKN